MVEFSVEVANAQLSSINLFSLPPSNRYLYKLFNTYSVHTTTTGKIRKGSLPLRFVEKNEIRKSKFCSFFGLSVFFNVLTIT